MILSYKDMWDMSLGGISKENEVPHWAGNLIYGFLFVLLKILFRFRADGLENLRTFYKRKGVVVVCNHTSFLDTVFLYMTARPQQWIRLLGRESLYGNAGGLVGQILTRVGSFPVKRASADMTAIKRATRMLKNAEAVGVFPEGTRRNKGSHVLELHAGAALIARMGKAPILPATVRNAEYIKQKGKFFRFPKVSVEYGRPVPVSAFDFLPKEDRLDGCSWYVMRECFALSRRCEATEIDMLELFPTAKDFSQTFREHPIPKYTSEELIDDNEGAGRTCETKEEATPQ